MSFSRVTGNPTPEVRTVTAWHEALNAGDVVRLVELSHPDVEVGGPRGTGHGAQLLREWADRANIHLEPGRIFQKADTVVVEQQAEWHTAGAGGSDAGQEVASIFVVRDGLVASVVRYPGIDEALQAADLHAPHESGPD